MTKTENTMRMIEKISSLVLQRKAFALCKKLNEILLCKKHFTVISYGTEYFCESKDFRIKIEKNLYTCRDGFGPELPPLKTDSYEELLSHIEGKFRMSEEE